MFKHSEDPVSNASVQSGDLLVLFTDGLTDLRNAADEFFGEERIIRSAQERRRQALKDIASEVLNEGMSFSSTPHPADDLTLFLLRFQ
jgi:serine phosphatase RsbU (regulator of sigma subunit)